MMQTDLHSLFSLENKVALITGASRGLGAVMAKALAQAGATMYINSRNNDALKKLASLFKREGIVVYPLPFDVENETEVASAYATISAEHGGVDILINNVGLRDRRGMFELDKPAMRKLFENHVLSSYDLCRTVAPMMKQRGSGRIINMISVTAFRAVAQDTAYITAKGSLAALTRAQAAELGEWGITVNALCPGAFATETNHDMANSEQGQLMVNNRSSLKRWGKPEEIAGAAIFLASNASAYMTGQVLIVDGGVLSRY